MLAESAVPAPPSPLAREDSGMAKAAGVLIVVIWWAGCFECGRLVQERGGFGSFYSYVRVVFWPAVIAGNEVPEYLFPDKLASPPSDRGSE